MASSTKTLADITDERQLPLGYLAALITLFLFMVAERVFYSQVGLYDGLGVLVGNPLVEIEILPICEAL